MGQLSFFTLQVLLYFQQDVIEAAYLRLVEAINSSKDFDEVVSAPESFLPTATSNCLLQAQELRHALQTVLHIATSFCRIRFDDAVVPPARPTDTLGQPSTSGWQASQ